MGPKRFGTASKVALVCAALLLLFILLFDWDWLRGPLNRTISEKTQRRFDSAHLDVDLGWHPKVRLRDVHFANADWAASTREQPMARIGTLEFTVSLRDLFDGKLLLPQVAVDDAELNFEKAEDGRRNWRLAEPSEAREPGRVRIGNLTLRASRLRYVDPAMPLDVAVDVDTLADAQGPYTTRHRFSGRYRKAPFSGQAQTGDVLSLQESGTPFPLQGQLTAGGTRLSVEGTLADVANLAGFDVRLQVAGNSLASLYPFLPLPLPDTPAYQLSGHLTYAGQRYAVQDLKGRIGRTDVAGDASYETRDPRPLLTLQLRSQLLNLPDLGPLVGKADKPAPSAPRNRLLPTGQFDGERLRAIDAQADLRVEQIAAPDFIALQNLRVQLDLKDGILRLDPFDVDLADGQIRSTLNVNAQQDRLQSELDLTASRLRLARLIPPSPRLAPSAGTMGVRAQLSGTGNTVADLAAGSNGSIQAALSRGQVSNLLDAVSGLNGGKIISLLLGGDQAIAINCGALSFAVKDGQGQSELFVIDTEDTRIDGTGRIDLAREMLDLTITPKPKRAGILSLRTPVHVFGSFSNPDYSLDKTGLALRGGGAIALALVNPLAALLPLIETGPGEDANCQQLLAAAQPATRAATRSLPPSKNPAP